MREIFMKVFFISVLLSLYLVFNLTAFGQCGPKGISPCRDVAKTTPKKVIPKKNISKTTAFRLVQLLEWNCCKQSRTRAD